MKVLLLHVWGGWSPFEFSPEVNEVLHDELMKEGYELNSLEWDDSDWLKNQYRFNPVAIRLVEEIGGICGGPYEGRELLVSEIDATRGRFRIVFDEYGDEVIEYEEDIEDEWMTVEEIRQGESDSG